MKSATIILAELVWYSPRLWPLAALAGLGIIILVAFLYRAQVRQLPQPWRSILPLLRTLGLLALVASILKPVAVRQASPADAGAILIVVDRSRSMSIHDLAYLPHEISAGRAAAAGHLAALADALGMIPGGVRDTTSEKLQGDVKKLLALRDDLLRARGELDFAQAAGQGAQEAKSRVGQAAAQFKTAAIQLADRAPSIPKDTYLRKALAALGDLARGSPDAWAARASNLLSELSDSIDQAQNDADLALYRSNAEVREACDRVAAMTRFERIEMALAGPGSGLLDRISPQTPLFGYSIAEDAQPLPLRGDGQNVRRLMTQPDGLKSDLTGGVAAALSRAQGQPLQAVIVFSDGQQVGGDSSIPPGLTAAGVPIFCVDAATRNPQLPLRDIAISRMSVPSSSFVGETVTARVELHSSGFHDTSATSQLSLAVDGGAPTTRPVPLNDENTTRDFPVKFTTPGIHRLVASVSSPPFAPTDENKQLQRWVKVLSDKEQIGLYAGVAGWDFQYVRDAMSRTVWIDLKDAILPDADAKFPLTPDQILSLDLLMLFDVSPGALSDQQWDAVYKLVAERGGSVILVAGDEHIPFEYADRQLPSSFLPYLPGQKPVWRTWPGKEPGFHLMPAPNTERLDALKLDDRENVSSDAWAQLPAFYRYLALPDLKPNARPLLVDRDSSSPVLLESRLGLGKVFFFGATETWRWRYKIGQKLQDRFWLQLVRYAADEPYAAEGKTIALDADPISAEPGQAIRVRARVTGSDGSPATANHQDVKVMQDGKVIKTVSLASIGASRSGRYRGTLRDVPAGDYQLVLDSPSGNESLSLPLHIAPSIEAEMANLNGSDQPMRRVSDATGGAFLTLDQVRDLPDLITASRTAASQLDQRPLWDSYYLYCFVLACFAAEWAIRKRVGLL